MGKINYNLFLYLVLIMGQRTISRSKLNKLIFFVDFAYYNFNNETITGDNYIKLPYGPIPEHIDSVRKTGISEKLINFKINEYPSHFEYQYTTSNIVIIDKVRDILEKEKKGSLDIIDLVLSKLGNKSASYLSELSHRIEPWKSAKVGDLLTVEKADNIYELIKAENKIEQIMEGW